MKALEIVAVSVVVVVALVYLAMRLKERVKEESKEPVRASIWNFHVSAGDDPPILIEWRGWGNNPVVVLDFGDGSETKSYRGSAQQAVFHAYENPGGYIISLRAYSADETGKFDVDKPDDVQQVPRRVRGEQ